MNRNLLLLACARALFLTNNVTFIAINGLVGLALAPWPWMATLPVTGYVVGAALAADAWVARLQARWGRKRSFQLGLWWRCCPAALCAWAAVAHRQLLAAGGGHGGGGLLQRQRRAVPLCRPRAGGALDYKEKAISWVLAGGMVGAFTGPNLASATRDWLVVPFVGAYLALMGVACCPG
jgi:hypothetical protein